MSQVYSSRRVRWLALGIALAAALMILVSVDAGVASPGPLPGADTIVLELEDGNNQFVYGSEMRDIDVGRSNCKLDKDSPHGEIMTLDAAVIDGSDPENLVRVSDLIVGLVDDGLGANESGRGNGQDCGRVDGLSEGLSESLTLTLGSGVANRLIYEVDFDFEAKFDALVEVDYLLDGARLFTEEFDLSDNGSDSGPDSKYLDKYPRTGPYELEHVGALFDGVRIRMVSGSVAVEGGDTWPIPDANRTVFHLQEALGCGDSATSGGPYLADDPLAGFYVGPNKNGGDCAVPVDIVSETSSEEQTVSVGPPSGFTWDGVTGVVTIEWDEEAPDLDGVDRTVQQLVAGDPSSEVVIPWCTDVIDLLQAEGEFFYELDDPSALYPTATLPGDVCLIFQHTNTVDDGGVIFSQTTETFYIWDDPIFSRPR